MNIKRFGLVVLCTVFYLFNSQLNVFAQERDYMNNGILEKVGYSLIDDKFLPMFDNDITTNFRTENYTGMTIEFDEVQTIAGVWANADKVNGLDIQYYDVNKKLLYGENSHILGQSRVRMFAYPNKINNVKYVYIGGWYGDPIRINEIDFISDLPDDVPPNKISGVKNVFNEDNSITYSYDFPSDSDFSHIEVYQDEQLIQDKYKLNSIKITGLEPLMNYNFKFIAVDTSGNKSEPYISTIQMPEGPDLIPPLEISDIKHVVSSTSVQFSYLLPIDDDFSHIQVWRNGVIVADNVKINSFNDSVLDYETTYNYVFKSVDMTGNVSNGSSLTVKTMPYVDDIAPLAVAGVDVISGNASLFLSWSASPENDVVGYNVYIDGVKRNGSPVAGNSFRMTNLVNGQEYSLQVSAVDTSGNESELTQTFVGVPDSAMLPIFKVDTDLSAVAKSTENWFSQLWLVTAFSASIPIAFFVGGRVKALFFA